MKNFCRTVFLFFCLHSPFAITGQNEFSKWYFGQNAGLDFSTQPPTVLTNGVLNTTEGAASICDSNGNLLFYTDGTVVYNSAHLVMANGSGLLGHASSAQSAVIVKQPGTGNNYYIFTMPGLYTGSTTPAGYSIVDMNLAAGLGSVTVKNATLYAPTCESQVSVRHCNGRDAWIISHQYNSKIFRAYLLSSAGVNPTPVISSIGENITNLTASASQIKVSPNGRKLAMATASNSPANPNEKGIFLFDFDPATGVISNSLSLFSGINIPNRPPYGVEFSADGTKLYGSTWQSNATLYQWDLCASTNTAIISSQYSLSISNLGSIQRAIDGKIYLSNLNIWEQTLHVINNPNFPGAAMNLSLSTVTVAPNYPNSGFPNYINQYTKPGFTPFNASVTCQKVLFAIPPVPIFSVGCSPISYAPNSYLWDFGEPGSGTANTSTLTNPVHTYSGTGIYTVSLILYSNCTNDTLQQTVTVTTPGPTLNVAGNFTICKGAKSTFTASGGSSYAWSTNTSGATVTLQPSQTTVYTATATMNGCQEAKQFTVTVDPCTGLDEAGISENVRIFPNPVSDLLHIECAGGITVRVRDLDGRVLKVESFDANGQCVVDLDNFNCGIYLIEIESFETVHHLRVVKK